MFLLVGVQNIGARKMKQFLMEINFYSGTLVSGWIIKICTLGHREFISWQISLQKN